MGRGECRSDVIIQHSIAVLQIYQRANNRLVVMQDRYRNLISAFGSTTHQNVGYHTKDIALTVTHRRQKTQEKLATQKNDKLWRGIRRGTNDTIFSMDGGGGYIV